MQVCTGCARLRRWPSMALLPSLVSLMLSTPSFLDTSLALEEVEVISGFGFVFEHLGLAMWSRLALWQAITLFPPPGCLNYRCLPPCPDWYWMVVKMFPCKHGKFGVLVPPWAYTSIFLLSTGRTMYSLWVTGKDKIILSLSPIKEASNPWRHSRSRAEESKTGLDCLTVLENKEVLKHL